MYSVELVSEGDGTIAKGLTFVEAEEELKNITNNLLSDDDVGSTYQIIETDNRKIIKEAYIQRKDIVRFVTL